MSQRDKTKRNEKPFRFQDLEIWKKAIEIGDKLFDIADDLEKKKLYRFAEQVRGAGLSISNNTRPVKQLEKTMYYTYVLQSTVDMKFYTGYTKDLKQRFEQHNKGLVDSTKDRIPLDLIYYEACIDQSDATKREKYLKSYHGKMFIRKRLKSYLTG